MTTPDITAVGSMVDARGRGIIVGTRPANAVVIMVTPHSGRHGRIDLTTQELRAEFISLVNRVLDGGDIREILPPPRAVVTASYLTDGASGPGIILEVCPCCTAQATLAKRDCFCRVQCTYAACPWDDPANLNAIARKADAAAGLQLEEK